MGDADVSVADRMAILDLIGRYLFAVDTRREQDILDCFCEDGIVTYDTGESFEGPEGLTVFARKAIGSPDVAGRMHLNFPLFFRRDGDCVILRSYLSTAHWRLPDAPTAFGSLRFIEDCCVMTDRGWRMKARHIHLWNDQTIKRWAGRG